MKILKIGKLELFNVVRKLIIEFILHENTLKYS